MIAEVQQIICLLASEPITVDELVHRFGSVTDTWDSNIFIKPYDPQFMELMIVRDYDDETRKYNNAPLVVDIKPAQSINFEVFAQTFGKYVENAPIPLPGFPREAIFRLEMPDKPYKVILIVDIKDNQVTNIFLRRDIKSKLREQ